MANTCDHAKYTTSIAAKKYAASLGLTGRKLTKTVEKCLRCGKWRVVL